MKYEHLSHYFPRDPEYVHTNREIDRQVVFDSRLLPSTGSGIIKAIQVPEGCWYGGHIDGGVSWGNQTYAKSWIFVDDMEKGNFAVVPRAIMQDSQDIVTVNGAYCGLVRYRCSYNMGNLFTTYLNVEEIPRYINSKFSAFGIQHHNDGNGSVMTYGFLDIENNDQLITDMGLIDKDPKFLIVSTDAIWVTNGMDEVLCSVSPEVLNSNDIHVVFNNTLINAHFNVSSGMIHVTDASLELGKVLHPRYPQLMLNSSMEAITDVDISVKSSLRVYKV